MGSTRLFPPRSALLPVVLAAASLTCGGDGVVLPDEGDPANAAVMDGNNQTGVVGTALAESLVVRITDPSNRPVVGARVHFVLGANATGGDVSPDTVVTDASGEAPVRWVLGTVAGTQAVQARVVGFTNVATSINAIASPAAADTIFVLKGDGQTGTAGAALAESLVVRVNDQFGNPVSGTNVSWTISGSGTVSPTNGATGPNGETAVLRTLGPQSGAQAAAASATGLKGSPVIFTHTAGSGAPATLQIVQGNNQTAPAGFALAESLVVRLVDANGNGVAGRAVAWVVPVPGGGGGTSSPTSTTTDANGLSATRWTLGTTAGPNTLIASAVGFVANFSATGTSDVPTRISIFSGNNQSGAAGQALPNDPTVLVQDANNNPVAGVAVTFTVTGGGGSIDTITVATGTNGRAHTSWTLGPATGPNSLQATASGPGGPLQGSPLTFTATAVAGSATQITVTTQPPSTAASGVALSPSPVVQIRDPSGNPVNQAGVNITVSLATGSGPLGGTLTRATNSSGQATFTGLSINGLIGSYSLAFNASGLTGVSSSSISLTAGNATRLVLSTQPPGGASSGVALSPQPIVQVQDAAGNPVALAGVNVTAALTGATGTLGGTTTIVTNAAGTAAFTNLAITGPSGSYSLQFTSTNPVLTPITSGNITIGAGAPTTIAINGGDNQSATAGTTLSTNPSVVIEDAGGNPVQGVTVTFAVASGGGTINGPSAVTNASGIAAVGNWTIGCVAGTNTLTATSTGLVGSPLTFTATGNVGPANRIQIQAGNNQNATVGTPVAVNPSVLVTDACGNPVQGISTTWAVTSGGGSTIGGNTTTDVNGLATVGWILGGTAGTNTLTVTRAGLTGSPITFTATAVTGSANNIAINAGNNQSTTIGTTVPVDPSVIVTDAGGNPVADIQVTFAIASGGGSIGGATDTTNVNGIATVGNWTLGTVAGTNSLTATAPGLVGSPVTFTATGTVGAASTIAINGGNNQTATAGTTLPVNPAVIVRDIGGNPVPGVSVTFAIASGGGSITGGAATTDASGIATVGSWTLGTAAGSNTITATSGSLAGSPITFSATGVAGPATDIAVNTGDNQTAPVGTTLPVDPSVLVTDANGNPVLGVSVTFAVASGGGTSAGNSRTTNANGVATIGSWTLGPTAGTNTLTATSAGLIGSPVTFTATGTVGVASSIAIHGGNNQTDTAGTTLPINPSVIVRDGSSNPVPGVSVTFAIASGGGSVSGGSATTDAGGIATVGSWTLGDQAGSNTMTATSAGLTGSPITFSATGVAGVATTIILSAGNNQSKVVNQVVDIDPAVLVTDANGNPVQGVTVTFAVTGGGGSATGTTRPSGVNGIAEVGSWQLGTTAGTNTLTATSPGLTGSPVTFTATGNPGVTAALQSTASVPGGVAGSQTTITIQARDQFGNLKTTGGSTFTVSVTGSNTATGAVTDNGDGTYTATYTPTVSGSDNVAIRLNGTTHIGGSPYTSTVAHAASSTTITGHAPDPSVVGQAIDVDVSVSGSVGTPTGNVTVGDGTVTCVATLSGGNGSCQLTPTTSGSKTLTATYNGNATYNSSVSPGVSHQVNSSGGVSPSQSTVGVSISSITASNGGSAVTVTVTARDGFGNPISGASVVLAATGGGTTITQPGLTNGSGVATGTLSSTLAGSTTISADINGTAINQQQVVNVTPAAGDPAQTTANVPSGSAGNPTNITIQVRDQFDNDLTAGGDNVVIDVTGANTVGPITATDNGDGTYSASYTPTVSGPDQVAITLNGSPISGSPYSTTVAVGSASKIQLFAGNNQSAPIGAQVPVNPTVIVRDGGNNPVSGITVGFAASGGGGSTTASSAVTNGSGQASVGWILGPTAGANTLTATSTGLAGSPVLFSATAQKGTSTTSITGDSPDPSSSGQAVTVTFNVTAAVATPTGNVTVSDGVNNCVATVAAGSCGVQLTTVGTRTLIASYAGDNNLNGSTSAGVSHTVTATATTTAITTHTPNPSVVGQVVNVDFTVSGGPTPTGNVTVTDGVTNCSGTVAAGTCNITLTNAGTATLVATYAGDATHGGSTSPGVAHTVNKAATTTTITADAPDPSNVGQAVNVDFTVTSSGGMPTGTVTVTDGVDNCSATVAVASCNISLTTVGARTLTATYAGDNDFNASTSAVVGHTVSASATTTTITSHTPNPSTVGQAVSVDFNVTGGTTPTGNVTVSDGVTSCMGTVAAGSCNITLTNAGTATLVATYPGDATHGGSTSAGVSHTVNKASTTTTITADTPDPSSLGQAVTVDFTVTSSGGNPAGTVTVSDGVDNCSASVAVGSCTLTLNTSGSRPLTAAYAGDANFNSSTSAGEPHTVNLIGTVTTITAHTPAPSVVGQVVDVDFTVSGGVMATGSVSVSDGTLSCNGALTGGSGSCSLTFPSAGSRTLTATYGGDGLHGGSTSPGVGHSVNAAATTTTITSHTPDPAVVGQAITVDYTVTVSSPGSGTPAGAVNVSDGTDGCSGTVAGGSCSFVPTASGAKTITVTYGGTTDFAGSSDNTSHQVDAFGAVSPAQTTANVPGGGSSGTPTTITIQAKDQFGNDVTVGGATVEMTVSGANNVGPITATDNNDGTYTISYTPLNSGPDQIDITLNGSPISGSPFTTTVATGSASQIQIFAGNNQSAPIGSAVAVDPMVLVTDAGGNPVPGIAVQFDVTAGGGSVAGGGQTGSNGQVGVAWTMGTTTGSNQLTASVPGLSGSPVVFSATAAPATPAVAIQSHTPDPSDAGQQVTVSYTVTSGVGSPSGNVTVSDGVDSCQGTVAAGSCSLSLTTPGNRTLVATYQGDANFNVASSAGVTHTVNQLASTTTITAHVPDPSAIGQGITVDVTVSGGGPDPGGSVTVTDQTDSCVITLAQGSGSCVLTPTTSGTRTLTADYGGDATYLASVSTGVTHQVDAFGAVDPATSTATVPDGVAGNVTTIVIVTRDQFGNPVAVGGGTVTVDITGANSGSAAVTDNGDGTYTATYTPGLAGNDSISIQINGLSIQGSPYTSTVS